MLRPGTRGEGVGLAITAVIPASRDSLEVPLGTAIVRKARQAGTQTSVNAKIRACGAKVDLD